MWVATSTMTSTFTALLTTARSYGGDLLKFGGDALLLLFTGQDHAIRAAAAVAEMHAELDVMGTIDTEGGRVELDNLKVGERPQVKATVCVDEVHPLGRGEAGLRMPLLYTHPVDGSMGDRFWSP